MIARLWTRRFASTVASVRSAKSASFPHIQVRKQVLGHLRQTELFDEQALSNLVVGFIRVKDWTAASQLMQRLAWPLPGFDQNGDLGVYLLTEWLQADGEGCLREALSLVKAMLAADRQPSALFLEALLTAALDRYDQVVVNGLLDLMLAGRLSDELLTPARLEDLIAGIHLRYGQYDRIPALLQYMRKRGEEPSIALWHRIFTVRLQPTIAEELHVAFRLDSVKSHSQARFDKLQSLLMSWKQQGVLQGAGKSIAEAMREILQQWVPPSSFLRYLQQQI